MHMSVWASGDNAIQRNYLSAVCGCVRRRTLAGFQ